MSGHQIDWASLDAALCERLEIEHKKQVCMCDGQECRSNCRGGKPVYPALSTTGDGMLTLMRALNTDGVLIEVTQHSENDIAVVLNNPAEAACTDEVISYGLPQALALAAASYFGIAVPTVPETEAANG